MRKSITRIPVTLFEIEDGGYHLFVEVEVNGKPATLLIDTGASKTVFDRSRVMSLLGLDTENPDFELSPHLSAGLGTNTMESHLVVIDSLKIGDLTIENFESVVLEIDHVNQSYELLGHKGIDGVLGSDLLKRYEAVIYYKKKILKLYY
jgi:predicted aspartyl protease